MRNVLTRSSRRRVALLVVAGGLVIGIGAGACSKTTTGRGGGGSASPDPTSFDEALAPSPEMVAFWSTEGPTFSAFASQADQLASLPPGAGEPECAAVAAAFDQIGTIEALAERAAAAPDPIYQEALSEQQAAVSSAFAACRGDAPVSFAEALEELKVSNDALRALLDQAGLR